MIHSAGEERAELLAREAVELFDAGHREVQLFTPCILYHANMLIV